MSTKLVKMLICVLFTSALGLSAAHAQSTGQVYQLSLSAKGDENQDGSSNKQTVVTATITTAKLINTARSRPGSATVPSNEALALALFFPPSGGQPTGGIIVWDTDGKSNLVTIVDISAINGAINSTTGKGFIAMVGEINSAGGLSNGWLAVSGNAKVTNPSSNTPIITKFTSTGVQGELSGTDTSSNQFDILITTGTIKLTSFLGNWIMPPAPM